MSTEPGYVYRAYDADDTLLYVGTTINPLQRISEHERGARWFEQVSTFRLEQFPTREAAMEAEMVAIEAEAPAFNIVRPREIRPASVGRKTSATRRARSAMIQRGARARAQKAPLSRLARLRIDAGLSPEQLGDAIAVSGMTIRRIEVGYQAYPSTLAKIAGFFSLTVGELLDLLEDRAA